MLSSAFLIRDKVSSMSLPFMMIRLGPSP